MAQNSNRALRRRVAQLSKSVTHLKRVVQKSPTQVSNISVYDFSPSWESTAREHDILDFETAETASEARDYVANLRSQVSKNTRSRLIVIEDLCSDLIAQLISAFGLSPEVLEEHLINSGWQGLAHSAKLGENTLTYSDSQSATWTTRRIAKEHVSIKWYRPCRISLRGERESLEIGHRQLFRYYKSEETEETEETEEDFETSYEHLHAYCNTWRQHLDFRTTSDGTSVEGSVNDYLTDKDIIAWEERLTLWQRQEEECHFVILLVDSGYATTFDVARSRPKKLRRRIRTNPNTSTNPATPMAGIKITPANPTAPSSPGEKATDTNLEDFETKAATQAFKPDDQMSSSNAPTGENITQHEPLNARRAPDDPITFVARNVEGSRGKEIMVVEHSPPASRAPSIVIQSRRAGYVPAPPERSYSILINVATRGPTQHINLDEAQKNDSLRLVTSTREDLGSWLEYNSSSATQPVFAIGYVSAVFNIVYYDTMDLLQQVDAFLSDTASLSVDEHVVQQNILTWRKMINNLTQELRYLEKAVLAFAKFLGPFSKSATPIDDDPLDIERVLLPDLQNQISQMLLRLDRSFQALVASVSIVESRRAISEAESVTKLTELAFFFLPLSFAASFFGMQVKELNPASTSVWGFAVMAVAVTLGSYAIRLLIRSDMFKRALRDMMTSVRRDASIRDGQPVRTKFFLKWMWHKSFGKALVVATGFLVGGVVPLLSIWTSPLMGAMKLVISLSIVITVLFTILALGYQTLSSRVRRWRRRRQVRTRRNIIED